MSLWVARHDWDVWITGTFRPSARLKDTINTKNKFRDFIEVISGKYDKHNIEYFMAVERFKSGYFTHVHAVLGGVGDLRYKEIGSVWWQLYGREKVERYEKNKGADYYLTKYITKELCDWDFQLTKIKN